MVANVGINSEQAQKKPEAGLICIQDVSDIRMYCDVDYQKEVQRRVDK